MEVNLNHSVTILIKNFLPAFAKCGSLEEAFKVVDYMMDRKLQLTPDTMNNLLLACRADRKAGFRNALLIYRKLIQYRLTPDIYHFNLLINCVRDCSIGDIDSTVDMLKMIGVENADEIASKTVGFMKRKHWFKRIFKFLPNKII